MKRRHVLALVGTVSTALAGCVDGNRVNDPGDGEDDGPTIDASIRTTGSDCGGPRDDWAVALEEDAAIAIEGTTPSPNPCHEAVLDDATLENGNLEVTVDVASTLEGEEDCAQCVGAVAYRVSVDGDVADVETVTVTHLDGDTHELEVFGADEAPRVDTTTIDTVGSDCGSSDEAAASITGPLVKLQGRIPAPDPCHLADTRDVFVEDNVLTVEIEPVPDEEADVCMTCVGEIEYEADVELVGPPRIDEIHVDHRDASEHVIAPDVE